MVGVVFILKFGMCRTVGIHCRNELVFVIFLYTSFVCLMMYSDHLYMFLLSACV